MLLAPGDLTLRELLAELALLRHEVADRPADAAVGRHAVHGMPDGAGAPREAGPTRRSVGGAP